MKDLKYNIPYGVWEKNLKYTSFHFCKGFDDDKDAYSTYPSDQASAREFLEMKGKWLQRTMKGLQRYFGLSTADPEGAAKTKCEGKNVSPYDPICVWFNAHQFFSKVFKPDFDNVFIDEFDELAVKTYLTYSLQHPAMMRACNRYPTSTYTTIVRSFLTKRFHQLFPHGGQNDLQVWYPKAANAVANNDGYFDRKYRERCGMVKTADDIYGLKHVDVNRCSLYSYFNAKTIPAFKREPFTNFPKKYVTELTKWFKDYHTNAVNIYMYTLPLAAKNELPQDCVRVCESGAYRLLDFCRRLYPLVEVSQTIQKFHQSDHSPNNKAAIELSLFVLAPKLDYLVLAENAKLSHRLLRSVKLDDLETYTEYLPSGSLLSKCPSVNKVCSLAKTFVNELRNYNHKKFMNIKNVNIIHTDVKYPDYLKQRALDEVLKINQDMPLGELANYIAGKIDSALGALKKYFQSTAHFDISIAKSDMGFITSSLKKFKTASSTQSHEVDYNIAILVRGAVTCTGLDLAEETAITGLKLAEACNPFKAVFNGDTASGILEAAQQEAQAIANVVRSQSLKEALSTLREKLGQLTYNLDANQIYIKQVKLLVDSVDPETKDRDKFIKQLEKFLKQYDSYSPALQKSDLTGMAAFWEVIVEEACDIIRDGTSVGCNTFRGIAIESKGLCWKTKIAVSKTIETYAEMYEYQFQFFDAAVNYMRAVLAYMQAGQIGNDWGSTSKGDPHFVEKLQITTAISFASYQFHSWATVEEYCTLLEYRDGGKRPNVCTGPSTNIASLVAHKPTPYRKDNRFYEIPAYFSNGNYPDAIDGKTMREGFLDLDALFEGKYVYFQVPSNDWLVEHKWVHQDYKDLAYYVKNFDIFLPIETETTLDIIVTAEASESTLHPNDDKIYALQPPKDKRFNYRQGKQLISCANKELPNPYAICADKPHSLCLHSGSVDPNDSELYPPLHSLWKLRVKGYENVRPHPNAATKLNVKVRMVLLYTGDVNVFEAAPNITVSSSLGERKCCTDNKYFVDNTCKACPQGSTSALFGYYCDAASKKTHAF